MKNKKTIFHPIRLIGALVFLMAFTLNIQTSLDGQWELVNVGIAQGSGGDGHARLCDKIWNIKVTSTGSECNTGGDYKCTFCVD